MYPGLIGMQVFTVAESPMNYYKALATFVSGIAIQVLAVASIIISALSGFPSADDGYLSSMLPGLFEGILSSRWSKVAKYCIFENT